MIPFRSYYSCHSGIISQVVTRSMGKMRAAEQHCFLNKKIKHVQASLSDATLEVMRPMEAAVSKPILLDLHIPAIVIAKIPEELTEVCLEHMEEIGPEASEMQTLDIAKLVETVASELLLVDRPDPAIFTEQSLEEHVEEIGPEAIEDVHSDLQILQKISTKKRGYMYFQSFFLYI